MHMLTSAAIRTAKGMHAAMHAIVRFYFVFASRTTLVVANISTAIHNSTKELANYHKPRPRRDAQTTTSTPQARACSARLVRGHVRCLCVFCASGQEEYLTVP